jgi:hypothetical protein
MNYLYKTIFLIFLVNALFSQAVSDVSQLSLDFKSRILKKSKYINISGEVYFKKSGSVLTTHLFTPFESVTMIDANGDVTNYDFKENSFSQSSSALSSSESSYFWFFLNGRYNDLGLPKIGYVIKETKTDEGFFVTTWVPKSGLQTPVLRIELVHEKSLPVYLEFIGAKNKKLGKIYFSNYSKIGKLYLPLQINEFAYIEKGDSIITTKTYSNPKTNEDVKSNFVDFKIPKNAKIINIK